MIGIKALFEAFGRIPAAVRWTALGAAILAGIAAATLAWLHFHDARVIDQDRAQSRADTAEAVTRADRAAIAADATRQQQRDADSAETTKAIDNAKTKHPVEVRRPAGPAVRAAADSLRRRSAASRDPAR